jgi:hypothetical protein
VELGDPVRGSLRLLCISYKSLSWTKKSNKDVKDKGMRVCRESLEFINAVRADICVLTEIGKTAKDFMVSLFNTNSSSNNFDQRFWEMSRHQFGNMILWRLPLFEVVVRNNPLDQLYPSVTLQVVGSSQRFTVIGVHATPLKGLARLVPYLVEAVSFEAQNGTVVAAGDWNFQCKGPITDLSHNLQAITHPSSHNSSIHNAVGAYASATLNGVVKGLINPDGAAYAFLREKMPPNDHPYPFLMEFTLP